jgi:hypothetical protein
MPRYSERIFLVATQPIDRLFRSVRNPLSGDLQSLPGKGGGKARKVTLRSDYKFSEDFKDAATAVVFDALLRSRNATSSH